MSKVFIITGASKGIGAAVVKYLLGQQHKLVLTARSENLLQSIKTAHPDQVEILAGDMTDSELPMKLTSLAVSSYGRLDGMVLSHGMLDATTLGETTMDDIRLMYDVNVFSCMAMAKAGLAEMRKNKGSIIWLSSGASVKTYKSWGAYGSSKAAVNSLSSHLALEEPDIASIAIAPGRVDTDMQAAVRSQGKDSMDKAVYDSFVQAYQDGTLLKPHQPGNVIARLVAKPPKDLSGKFLSWNAPELVDYQE